MKIQSSIVPYAKDMNIYTPGTKSTSYRQWKQGWCKSLSRQNVGPFLEMSQMVGGVSIGEYLHDVQPICIDVTLPSHYVLYTRQIVHNETHWDATTDT